MPIWLLRVPINVAKARLFNLAIRSGRPRSIASVVTALIYPLFCWYKVPITYPVGILKVVFLIPGPLSQLLIGEPITR